MKASHLITSLFAILALASCSSHPLTTEVIGLPATATAKRDVAFKVIVRNVSAKTQILPTEYEVEFTTSIRFIPDATPGVLLSKLIVSGDYAINRNVISICPPQFDHLESGAFREYNLKWSPTKEDQGTGALAIALPYSFPEIPLQPMTIQKTPNKAEMATPRKPSDQF